MQQGVIGRGTRFQASPPQPLADASKWGQRDSPVLREPRRTDDTLYGPRCGRHFQKRFLAGEGREKPSHKNKWPL